MKLLRMTSVEPPDYSLDRDLGSRLFEVEWKDAADRTFLVQGAWPSDWSDKAIAGDALRIARKELDPHALDGCLRYRLTMFGNAESEG